MARSKSQKNSADTKNKRRTQGPTEASRKTRKKQTNDEEQLLNWISGQVHELITAGNDDSDAFIRAILQDDPDEVVSANEIHRFRARVTQSGTRATKKAIGTSIKCVLNTIILAAKHVYGFKEIEPATDQKGRVSSIEQRGEHLDWDVTFNVDQIDPSRVYNDKTWTALHCEITPCDQRHLRKFIRELEQRIDNGEHPRVSVDGMLSFDPKHTTGGSDQLEVHSIRAARFI